MSVLSRVSAPEATHDLADVVVALFSNPERTAPRDLPRSIEDQLSGNEYQLAASVAGRLVTDPTGLGTSAARIPWRRTTVDETVAATGRGAKPHMLDGPTGLGTSAVRVSARPSADAESSSELYCPPALAPLRCGVSWPTYGPGSAATVNGTAPPSDTRGQAPSERCVPDPGPSISSGCSTQ